MPPIQFEITQDIRDNPTLERQMPSVGFNLSHLGNSNPVKAKVETSVFLDRKSLGPIDSPYYNGKIKWHLNPQTRFFGNFSVAKQVEGDEKLTIEVKVTIIDIYEREHELLPVCFTYVRKNNYWFLEPTSFVELSHQS